MNHSDKYLLTLNAGSSSIKFALFRAKDSPERIAGGQIERIGMPGARLILSGSGGGEEEPVPVLTPDHRAAAHVLIDWLEKHPVFPSIMAVGHRVVHGLNHPGPALISPALLNELKGILGYDPDHLPQEIEAIDLFRERYPRMPQVACFDTSFHAGMPRVAKLLPIPRRFDDRGIRRYGFHGLSYTYIMEELRRLGDARMAAGRLVLAHLGSGASMAAVRGGQPIDTSMGFTPSGGLVMGTRPGDLDPGVAWYITQADRLSPEKFNSLINHESGLLGMSETSPDMRDLLQAEDHDIRAAEALAVFCYQARKWVGAFAAVLGGLDGLVFAGGVGENAAAIRSRICENLEFLGIRLDERNNAGHAAVISAADSRVVVRIIRTDEELTIAKSVRLLLEKINIPA